MKKLIHKTIEINGEEQEIQETVLVNETGPRGFGRIGFIDRYHSQCSLQDSSIATEPCIWLGVSEIVAKRLIPGQGWKIVPLDPDLNLNERMHLTQSMVKQLLPFLTHFAETGQYLTECPEFAILPKSEG